MRKSAGALFLICLLCFCGTAPADTSVASTKEFRTSEGLVRITLVRDAGAGETDSSGGDIHAIVLDSITVPAALTAGTDGRDPLLDVYYLDIGTGEELHFPAKMSHMREFLLQHRDEFVTGSTDERTVAMVRALSRDLRVHMKTPGSGGSK